MTMHHTPPMWDGRTYACADCRSTTLSTTNTGWLKCDQCGSYYLEPGRAQAPAGTAAMPTANWAPSAPSPGRPTGGGHGKFIAIIIGIVALVGAATAIGIGLRNNHNDAGAGATDAGIDAAHSKPATTGDTYIPVDARSWSGSGDDVIDLGDLTKPAIVTFRCAACSANVVVKSNGPEGLLVNTIGAYAGSHFINMRDGSLTTQIEINADASWKLSLDDAARASDATSGHGDQAIIIDGNTTKATIRATNDGNFIVQVYSINSGMDLAVNTIGSYQGTVLLDAPAFVQIEATGSWDIEPK